MEKYPQILVNVHVQQKLPIESLNATSRTIRDAEHKLKADGRVLVRYSGTENLLRVMVEGKDKDVIDSMAHDIAETAQKEIMTKSA